MWKNVCVRPLLYNWNSQHKSSILSELNDLSVSTGDGSPNSAFGGGPLSPRHALRELEKAMPKVRINNYINYLV